MSFTNHSHEETGCHPLGEEILQEKPQIAGKGETVFRVQKLRRLVCEKMQIHYILAVAYL